MNEQLLLDIERKYQSAECAYALYDVRNLTDEVRRLHRWIDDVRRAVEVPGPNPGLHRAAKRRVREDWPRLWHTLTSLLDHTVRSP